MERFIKAQGDVTIISLHGWTAEEREEFGIPTTIPVDVKEATREGGRLVVAHSETGHHHVMERPTTRLLETDDPFTAYLDLAEVDGIHHIRSFDTHAPIEIPPGQYLVKRGREFGPEGWRRAQD